MALHTTNYFDTFIEVAEDTKALTGTIPSAKGDKSTIAQRQFALIANHPYKYTSDEVFFRVFADKNELNKEEIPEAKEAFFSKGQACLRASPLTKTHGFGVHFDSKGKVAIYGMETREYEKFISDQNLKKVRAMRSSRKAL